MEEGEWATTLRQVNARLEVPLSRTELSCGFLQLETKDQGQSDGVVSLIGWTRIAVGCRDFRLTSDLCQILQIETCAWLTKSSSGGEKGCARMRPKWVDQRLQSENNSILVCSIFESSRLETPTNRCRPLEASQHFQLVDIPGAIKREDSLLEQTSSEIEGTELSCRAR